jgi:hypothetical protein
LITRVNWGEWDSLVHCRAGEVGGVLGGVVGGAVVGGGVEGDGDDATLLPDEQAVAEATKSARTTKVIFGCTPVLLDEVGSD